MAIKDVREAIEEICPDLNIDILSDDECLVIHYKSTVEAVIKTCEKYKAEAPELEMLENICKWKLEVAE